jgi:hypothetical protein
VQPPFDKTRLAERNELDARNERTRAPRDPAAGIAEVLELSETVRRLAQATGAVDQGATLADKARLWVRPLRALVGK